MTSRALWNKLDAGYDFESQLTSTATGGSTVSSFAYDALGRRYSRTNGGTTTRFLYGPGGILCEKQGGSFTAAYAYGNGLIRKDGEYPMFDGLGSVRTTTNSSQTATATATYEGFGSNVASTGSSGSGYGFAGMSGYRNDGDAGLTHVGARYFDAQVGRFITRDSELGQHPFNYCEHDPVNSVDPSGHWPVPDLRRINLPQLQPPIGGVSPPGGITLPENPARKPDIPIYWHPVGPGGNGSTIGFFDPKPYPRYHLGDPQPPRTKGLSIYIGNLYEWGPGHSQIKPASMKNSN